MSTWKTNTAKTRYDNPWIHLSHRDVTTPNHTPAIYGKIHFKNLAIGILPIDTNGHIHLVGQSRYTLNIYSWEIPEGGCPLGENPLDTAQRELLEETGLKANYWHRILDLHTSNSVTDERALIYLAVDLIQGEKDPEHTELFQHEVLDLDTCLRKVELGSITDAMSISTLHWYKSNKSSVDSILTKLLGK
jgi:8-oxo-dGTP pyrophosphatase MutT (NUDIX family)